MEETFNWNVEPKVEPDMKEKARKEEAFRLF
jgi:hypothetical protein